jgi:CRISPR-associated protein Cas1
MKKFLNILFVASQGLYLHREGETLVAELEREVKLRLPIHTLAGIVCFGNVMCSPFLLGLCGERGVHVSFLSEHGRFLARVSGPVSGNVLLRRAQFRTADNPQHASAIARNIVIGKILNSRSALQRRIRDHGADDAMSYAIATMARIATRLQGVEDLNGIRGLEGEAANLYFAVFDKLIVAQKTAFAFKNRSRRPPLDPVNALLSFLYTLLAHDCVGALEAVGLDPQMGFLHAPRPGRPSLALDLMEEFRSILADRVALSLINLSQIKDKDFTRVESGAVMMKDDARKLLLTTWQKKKQEEIIHPFLNEKMAIGLLPYAQALLLARHLRGDLDAYPPFILK